MWRDIKGFEGKYQVSYYGEIRRLYSSGKVRKLTPYIKTNRREILFVGLIKDGVKKEFAVHKLVAETFLGEPRQGQVIYHINGLIKDNIASNLKYIDRQSLGRLTGSKSTRRAVAKIDSKGEVVEFYPSAREAAKVNFMSYQTVIDRCNGKVKGPFAPDGYAYAWEDCQISMRQAISKIKLTRSNIYEKN